MNNDVAQSGHARTREARGAPVVWKIFNPETSVCHLAVLPTWYLEAVLLAVALPHYRVSR
jgi:hypothetical protein